MRSKARGTSYFLARMKQTSMPSGFSPKVSSTPLARSSPASAFSLIIPLSSLTANTRFSSVSFSSSLPWFVCEAGVGLKSERERRCSSCDEHALGLLVVTGATDGIGKVYAEELARKGFAMMLISRSQDKLDDVARQLEEQYKVETRTIAVDFGLLDIYPKVEAGLAGLEIGVLVNNVGISYPYPEYFLHIPDLDNFITNMINVNMTSVCQMTRLVLPRMVQRSKGVVLNISSASGMYPVPLLTSVLPFFVATKMTRIRKPTLDKPTPERYGWLTTVLVPINLVIYFGARMNRAQRTGYLKRRKLRDLGNQSNGKSDRLKSDSLEERLKGPTPRTASSNEL
ncbi:unnamed protein product [Coregonus sp. 'balchen']|nr:unnamed protein product [Coregonus sp. 'balchen']